MAIFRIFILIYRSIATTQALGDLHHALESSHEFTLSVHVDLGLIHLVAFAAFDFAHALPSVLTVAVRRLADGRGGDDDSRRRGSELVVGASGIFQGRLFGSLPASRMRTIKA